MMGENGRAFLMVDGACQYWVFPGRSFSSSEDIWSEVITGELTDGQVEALESDLEISRWVNFENDDFQSPEHPHALRREFWTKSHEFQCGGDCVLKKNGADVSDIAEQGRRWIEMLRAEGEEVSGGLRVLLVERESDTAMTTQPVPEGLNVDEVAISEAECVGYCEGGSRLLEGDVAATLRSYRRAYLDGDHGEFQYLYIPLRDEEDQTYELYLRDAIPYEDEQGLIGALDSSSHRSCD